MKIRFFPALACTIVLAATGCRTAEGYKHNNTATEHWLVSHAGPPAENVAGKWKSDDWGAGEFKQSGNRVTGILGKYPIGGVLNGDKLYLAITSRGWTVYTAILEPKIGTTSLDGCYSSSVPYQSDDRRIMTLDRVKP